MVGGPSGGCPNLIIISVDSLRRDYCSLYNSDMRTTPFLESLDDATVFEQAISPSVWTLQVHGSIFTGLYPPEHGILDKDRSLGDHPTLAERLSEAGYTTESFGKNGWLESGDILRGFDHHRPQVSAHVREQLGNPIGAAQTGDVAALLNGVRNAGRALAEKVRRRVFRHTPVASASVDLLLEHLDRSDEPFCYFFHTNDVHYVYRPTAPYHREYGSHSLWQRISNLQYQRALVDNRARIYAKQFEFDREANAVMRDLYRGCVRQTDALLKRLFEGLDARGKRNDTIVVLFSDHGDHLCDDHHFGHQFSVADELIRVPLVIIDPTDTFEAGRRSDIVQLNDLYPTLANLLNIDVPETRSFDVATKERDAAFVYYSAPQSLIDRLTTEVERDALPPSRQYAVWEGPDRKGVLFPDEDRFVTSNDAEVLRSQLDEHTGSFQPVASRQDAELSKSVEQDLQELGYL